jgi:hypothetical protein
VAEPNTVFYIKQHNLLKDLTGQFLHEDTGLPLDLAPGGVPATLQFRMWNPRTGAMKVDRAAAIDGPAANGRWRYVWQTGDTDTEGTWHGEVKVTFAGRPLTVPNRTSFRVVITKAAA